MSRRNLSRREAETAAVVDPAYAAIDARIRHYLSLCKADAARPLPELVPGIGLVCSAEERGL